MSGMPQAAQQTCMGCRAVSKGARDGLGRLVALQAATVALLCP